MKKLIMVAVALLLLLPSCKDAEFTNPWDRSASVNAPSQLAVTDYTDTTITFAWKDNSNNETGFSIEYMSGSSAYTFIGIAPANATTVTLPFPLRYNSTYRFRIQAINHVNKSNYSDFVQFTLVPESIVNFKLISTTESTISFQWLDTIKLAHTVALLQTTDNVTYTTLATFPAHTQKVTIPFTFQSGNFYYFTVACVTSTSVNQSGTIKVKEFNTMVAGGLANFTASANQSLNLTTSTNGMWMDYSVTGPVFTAEFYHNDLYVGGKISKCGDVATANVGRLSGSAWYSIPSLNDTVFSMKTYNDALYIGGRFGVAGGSLQTNFIAKWDGTSFSKVGGGMNGDVYCLETFKNRLVAGGSFTSAGGVSANGIAMWDGNAWSPMGEGLNGSVRALLVYNGELYAAGAFSASGGIAMSNIARWDGVKWNPIGNGLTGTVYALTVYNNMIHAGGNFYMSYNIANWDGTAWQPVYPMTGTDYSLLMFNNQLYAGGNMHCVGYSNTSYNNFFVFNGSVWKSAIFTTGTVYTLKQLQGWKSE